MPKINLFCLPQNKEAEATLERVGNELIATWEWTEPGPGQDEQGQPVTIDVPKTHFVKFPTTDENGQPVTADVLRAWIAKHNEHNVPVVTAAEEQAQFASVDEMLASL